MTEKACSLTSALTLRRERTWGVPGRGPGVVCECVEPPQEPRWLTGRPTSNGAAMMTRSMRAVVRPSAVNIEALAAAALECGHDGSPASFTVTGGGRRLSGAVIRRLRMRAGLARLLLEMVLDFAAREAAADALSDMGQPTAEAFRFDGARCRIDSAETALVEFSLALNNNISVGGPDEAGRATFIAAGRQSLTGYICLAGGGRALVDGEAHSLEIALPDGRASHALIVSEDILFTWRREIVTTTAGELEVVYFEDGGSSPATPLTVSLSK